MSRLIFETFQPGSLPWGPRTTLLGRRGALRLAAAVGGGLWLMQRPGRAEDCALPARTPIEGPYFLGEPEERNDTGDGLVVQGRVQTATCEPIPGATVVRWHANRFGIYEEYYRATMLTGADGAFEMSTNPPGKYANLDRHIHWYVTAPGHAPLLAQLQWADGETIGGEEIFDFTLVPA